MSQNMYIDFHVIQTVPPSCVNRDDTGSPKTAMYGGVMRARVSSQAWKRAMRQMFKELFTSEHMGYRTKKLSELVVNQICADNEDLTAEGMDKTVKEVLELAGVKAGSDKKDALFFVSARQVKNFANLTVKYYRDSASKDAKKKTYKSDLEKAVKDEPSADILLFGRMAASNPSLNYDAAAQVAHAISTHRVSNEYDYFTAVDDCGGEESTGAGHLGTVEFNSSTMYRYATVNIRELAENLTGEELKMVARGFAEAFIRSMPTGKQNTFANRTLPNMVYVAVRDDQPVNLVGAFERPVMAVNSGYVETSEAVLAAYASRMYEDYGNKPVKAWVIGKDYGEFGEKVNLMELLDRIEQVTETYFDEGK